MEQLSICQLKMRKRSSSPQFVVVLQRDLLNDLNTRVNAPLVPLGKLLPTERLNPKFQIEGKDYVVMIDRMAAVDLQMLIPTQNSAYSIRFEIIRAIDMLLQDEYAR